jgi:hypothetical protein
MDKQKSIAKPAAEQAPKQIDPQQFRVNMAMDDLVKSADALEGLGEAILHGTEDLMQAKLGCAVSLIGSSLARVHNILDEYLETVAQLKAA